MAWISVHEQILGGKLRVLAKNIGCSQNEALGILIRLWLWGINNADKYGFMRGTDKDDIADVLNVGLSPKINSSKVIDSLIEAEWIDEVDDCLVLHDWEEWQEQWYKAIEARAKNTEKLRKYRANKKNSTNDVLKNALQEDNVTSDLINLPSEEKKTQTSNYSNDFEEFWEVYPKKVGKGEAYKKYKARKNDGWSPEELLEAAQNYLKKCVREKTDKQYIKHPKTFLSETTPFTDFIRKDNSFSTSDIKEVKQVDSNDPYAAWRN